MERLDVLSRVKKFVNLLIIREEWRVPENIGTYFPFQVIIAEKNRKNNQEKYKIN